MTKFWHEVAHAYDRHIVAPGKEQAFWVLVSFLLTFLVVRLITHAIRAERGPFHNLSIRNTHLHHLVPGIFLLLITGYLASVVHPREWRTTVAIGFGIGAALTLDEFALWLHLEDVYWAKQGRRSVDAVICAATVAGLALLGVGFWRDLFHAAGKLF